MYDTAALVCPRCLSDAGLVARPPLAVCLACGLPLWFRVGVVIVTPLMPADVDALTDDQRVQLARLLFARDDRA